MRQKLVVIVLDTIVDVHYKVFTHLRRGGDFTFIIKYDLKLFAPSKAQYPAPIDKLNMQSRFLVNTMGYMINPKRPVPGIRTPSRQAAAFSG
jgi:hypothetical protein